jgi:hypothetical protein
MNWLVQNLWLIPELPLLAAGLSASRIHPPGAERREMVAHGVRRGTGVESGTSSVGATQ